MRTNDTNKASLSRRDLLSNAAAATGALVVGFWMPQRAAGQIISPQGAKEGATWATEPNVKEINAWVVVAPDETVTIRIAQTELGQGVWTSNAMMVCEELQCDWSKVRPQYASANRDGQEMAPEWTLEVMGKGATDPFGGGEPEFGQRGRTGTEGIPNSLYRRMRTNAAASVKDGRYYLQLAGAEARERLLLAAAKSWGVPVAEVSSVNSVITHAPSGRTTTYGQMAALAAQTPHPNPERIRIFGCCRSAYGAASSPVDSSTSSRSVRAPSASRMPCGCPLTKPHATVSRGAISPAASTTSQISRGSP